MNFHGLLTLVLTSKLYKKSLGLFRFPFRLLPVSSKKVVFFNFNGKGYGDNPKYVAQEIIRQQLNYDLVWVVNDMKEPLPKEIRPVKMWTLRYVYELATAKVIVSNVKNYLPFVKRCSQYYVQTWHGAIPFKNIEKDAEATLAPAYIKESKANSRITDVCISCNSIQSENYREAFWFDGEIMECGYPRSDFFFSPQSEKDRMKTKMKLPADKGIMLYCPTFRDNGASEAYGIVPDQILDALHRSTGREWILLVRMHPNDKKGVSLFRFNDRVINMTAYPDMQELLFVADAQITDYSSTIAEFLIMQKPVFVFASDLEEYSRTRGLSKNYFELPFKINRTNDELVQTISAYSEIAYIKAMAPYMQRYNSFDDGHASERVVARIKSVVDGSFKK